MNLLSEYELIRSLKVRTPTTLSLCHYRYSIALNAFSTFLNKTTGFFFSLQIVSFYWLRILLVISIFHLFVIDH